MTVAIALPELWLDSDTLDLVAELENRLNAYQPANLEHATYYGGKQRLQDMNIAIPPMLRAMTAAIGWPSTAVDVLEERLSLRGWSSPGVDFDLAEVFTDNDLDVQSGLAHLDALIYGCAFVAVSSGYDDEPDPLITVESPTTMTAMYSSRARRVEAALAVQVDESVTGTTQLSGATLYLPTETLTLTRNGSGTAWGLEDRDEHNLGRVPVTQLINRPRAGDMDGHSEITETVKSYTDAAMRTIAAAEVAREFHASPQRYVLGAPESFFIDEETGQRRGAWESYLGRILAIERDESGEVPTVGQFRGGPLSPYFEMIKNLCTLFAAESSIPAHYLGFVTDNPTSADAIRQSEARLVKRVEKRQVTFGMTWTEVARLAVLIRDGSLPDEFGIVRPEWLNAATPTKAADADRIIKLIQTGVLTPDSEITYEELNFTPDQVRQLRIENQQRTVTELVESLGAAAQAARQQPGVAELGQPPAAGATMAPAPTEGLV